MLRKLSSNTVLCALFTFLLGCGGASDGAGGGSTGNSSSGGMVGGATGFVVDPGASTGDGTDGESDPDAGPTDGETEGVTGGHTEPVFDGIAGFPSEELFLQIVGPSEKDHTVVGGGVTYAAGVLFGKATEIVWQSSTGETGQAEGDRFWKTGPIALAPGDNTIVLKAIGEDGTESVDTITITYNPGFQFSEPPVVRPSGIITGVTVDVAVNMQVTTKNILPSSVTLWEVDQNGNNLGKIGPMVDNGNTSNPDCDEIQDDGVYSSCASLYSAVETTRYLRVSLQVSIQGALYTVFSPIVPFHILDPVTPQACQGMVQAQKDAQAFYNAEVAAGNANPSAAVLSMLQNNPLVLSAGSNASGYGIWMEFQGGVLGALNVSSAGARGGGDPDGDDGVGTLTAALVGNTVPIESKNVLALAPFNGEFGALDEIPQISSQLQAQQCPEFQVSGPHLNGGTTLARMRDAYNYGIVLYSGHSDNYFLGFDPAKKAAFGWEHDGSQEILWTGETVDCNQLSTTMATCSDTLPCSGNSTCIITTATGASASGVCVDQTQLDLRRGRVVLGETWGVHPEFFERHSPRSWPSSLVYLGGCRTLYNGTLAAMLFGLGAKAIVGYTGYVSSAFASEQSRGWVATMLAEQQLAGYATLFPVVDPNNPEGQFAIFGGKNVEITEAEILNADFERGDTTGWNVEGDGRVISQLGMSIPVGGKFMAVLSTGLGYTQQTGELNQAFCIPEGVQKVSVFWKFFSEEFLEWCGSIYQDAFRMTLETSQGQITLVDANVDDLCAPSECVGCGGQYVGLIPSDVSFDQGGVYNTQWLELTKDIGALAGAGPVTLRLFTTDQGDSIYDTVILVDSIKFE